MRTTVRGGPSGGYESLTGLGEGETPGALAQAGEFTIVDSHGFIYAQFSIGAGSSIQIGYNGGGGGPPDPPFTQNLFEYLFGRTTQISNDWSIEANGITITANTLAIAAAISLSGTTGGTVVRVGDNLLGFFGVAPAAQPAAPTTLAGVIAALQTLGLVA